MASESFSNPVRFYFENPHRNSTTVPRYLTWQMAGGRRSSLGCLSRSVGPSRFSLSPLFTPWRQPRDDQLNLAVFFPLTPHTMLYVWRLTSTWKFTPSLCVWNLDMLFCFLVFVFVFKKKTLYKRVGSNGDSTDWNNHRLTGLTRQQLCHGSDGEMNRRRRRTH